MNRALGIERVFNLGDYKSLRVTDYLNELPEEWALNDELVDKLRYLQMVGINLVYNNYVRLAKRYDMENLAEAESFLIEERANTMDAIKQLILDLNKENK